MKKIALEEHVLIPGAEKIVPEHKTHLEFKDNMKVLLDITHDRLRAMDEGDIEISVLSTTSPGLQGLDEASAKDLRNISVANCQGLYRRWGQAAICGGAVGCVRKLGNHSRKSESSRLWRTAQRTCNNRWAPWADQRIGCLLPIR